MAELNERFSLAAGAVLALLLLPASARGQQLPGDVQGKVDSVVGAAYQAATAQLPCKIKTGGKLRMIRWQDVDKCLNNAANRVDWDAIAAQIAPLREASGQMSPADFNAALEAAFAAHSLTYEKVLAVKRDDAHLPLTNSVLRFLPPGSLEDVPVIDKNGKQVGTFAGTYFSERTGGLATANTYRIAMFQYKDANGNLQSPNERLLLDSFGVPWSMAKGQPGFRLTTEKLPGAR
jgi:hypothetical protein